MATTKRFRVSSQQEEYLEDMPDLTGTIHALLHIATGMPLEPRLQGNPSKDTVAAAKSDMAERVATAKPLIDDIRRQLDEIIDILTSSDNLR